jgi:hypothetical protein
MATIRKRPTPHPTRVGLQSCFLQKSWNYQIEARIIADSRIKRPHIVQEDLGCKVALANVAGLSAVMQPRRQRRGTPTRDRATTTGARPLPRSPHHTITQECRLVARTAALLSLEAKNETMVEATATKAQQTLRSLHPVLDDASASFFRKIEPAKSKVTARNKHKRIHTSVPNRRHARA